MSSPNVSPPKPYVKTPVKQEMVKLTDTIGVKPLTNVDGLKKFMNSLLRKPSDWT